MSSKKPYVGLGKQLKSVRLNANLSLAEVSGAVEIGEDQLKQIESGVKRPEEEVMLLLISYFNLADQEALDIWQLADYDSDLSEHLDLFSEEDTQPIMQALPAKQILMLLSIDVRTMYSDGVEIDWNESGISLNFTQSSGDKKVSIAKVGMSHEQAQKVSQLLEKALRQIKYNGVRKMLPPSQS